MTPPRNDAAIKSAVAASAIGGRGKICSDSANECADYSTSYGFRRSCSNHGTNSSAGCRLFNGCASSQRQCQQTCSNEFFHVQPPITHSHIIILRLVAFQVSFNSNQPILWLERIYRIAKPEPCSWFPQ
jgi:hypothetical protein